MAPFRKLLGLLAATSLVACGSSDPSRVAGGSGTEAENALTVSARANGGAAAAGASVEVWPAGQVSASAGTAPILRDTTDAQGRAVLSLPVGEWSVLVRKGSNAFRGLASRTGGLQDTLRPMARLVGVLAGGAGKRVALVGLGRSVVCGADGSFALDSLPSGPLTLAVEGQAAQGSLTLIPGANQLTLGNAASLPVRLESVVSDSILVPRTGTGPVVLAHAVLRDTGAFAVALCYARTDTTGTATLFDWTDGASSGVTLGWAGADTLVLQVDGKVRKIAGIALDSGIQQMGLAWTGSAFEVWLAGDLVASLTGSGGIDRKAWTDPVLAGTGVSRLQWLTVRAGAVPSGWFATLAGM